MVCFIFGSLFDNFLDFLGAHFGAHFGTRSAQEGNKTSPRGPSRASKTKKLHLKKVAFAWDCRHFSLLSPPKRASRGPRRLPRGIQRAPRPQKKRGQNWTQKLTNFGRILEPMLGPQNSKKYGQNCKSRCLPFPRIPRIQIMPRQKINERCEKTSLTGIILYKRKRGIRPYEAL